MFTQCSTDSLASDPRFLASAHHCVRFGVGQVHTTQAALAALFASGERAHDFVERHARGDFGEAPKNERDENLRAARTQRGTILSMYRTKLAERVWVATNETRSRTLIFLPDEIGDAGVFDEREEPPAWLSALVA